MPAPSQAILQDQRFDLRSLSECSGEVVDYNPEVVASMHKFRQCSHDTDAAVAGFDVLVCVVPPQLWEGGQLAK